MKNRVFKNKKVVKPEQQNPSWLEIATYLLYELEQDEVIKQNEKEQNRYYKDMKKYLLSYRN